MPTVIGLEICRSGIDGSDLLKLKECLINCTSEIYSRIGSFENGLRAIGFNDDCTKIVTYKSSNWQIIKTLEDIDIPIPTCAKCYKELVLRIYEQICKKVPSFSRPDRHPIAVSYDPRRCKTGIVYITDNGSRSFEYQFGLMGDDMYESTSHAKAMSL